MRDITEKENIEYLMHGLRKARSAAKEISELKHDSSWKRVAHTLDTLIVNATRLSEARAMSRLQTLAMANKIEQERVH